MAMRVARITLEDEEETYFVDVTNDSDRDYIAISLLEKFSEHIVSYMPTDPDSDDSEFGRQVRQEIAKLKLITGEGEAFKDYRAKLQMLESDLDIRRIRYKKALERKNEIEKILEEKDGVKACETMLFNFSEFFNLIEVKEAKYAEDILNMI